MAAPCMQYHSWFHPVRLFLTRQPSKLNYETVYGRHFLHEANAFLIVGFMQCLYIFGNASR
uniref:Uncharacterized protein n=1 Tax=mine drainage metagenome TaxID=410659 RepID=E6QPS4_9ZZZZ